MSVNRIHLLLWALVVCGGAMADENASIAKPECGEAMGSQSLRRSAYFAIERNAEGFEYKCTLRKKRQRKKDHAGFRRECVTFVNKFIATLNRCEDAGIPAFALDPMKEHESNKTLEYIGFIPIGFKKP